MVSAAPVLHYFAAYGSCEVIRMALHYFHVPFTEVNYDFRQWSAAKASGLFEFTEMPMMEIGEKRYVLSAAILRYLCQLYAAYPTDVMEIAKVEAIREMHDEIYEAVMPFMYIGQVEAAKDWFRLHMSSYLPLIEAQLQANPSGQGRYFLGSHVSIADFIMFEMGFNFFLRPQMMDLGLEFQFEAPRYFAFLREFPQTDAEFAEYMKLPKELAF